ncbi:hypothetical protein PV08_08592 [Exophiala spinifera]|uniref:SPX domain-containing protein n=1 Tax=Exophiala spinifera TaxID=91928 RepID=A0A0D2BQJ4_9EURO|nr:uncharacterized protein PV08_08592 [Exophiala spinifera]KIW13404.1 hypothetical protein PV08_08592 [Exophiala spinifera]
MKFGDTLYQRSVPKWTAYNVKYNELKHLIKIRTSAGVVVPVGIPVQGKSKWEELENELYTLIEGEYNNVTLFLRSKQGEIERRLAYVEKQIKLAQRAVEDNALHKSIIQARKYRQLIKDVDGIGDEVQNLSRFAAVQKTAFRKILKKYRKWTGSTALQTRLDVEVFSSKKLQTDFSDYLQELSEQKAILTEELAGPMLTGRPGSPSSASDKQQKRISASMKRSSTTKLNEAVLRGSLAFDAAILTVPYGETAGSVFYWIHQDNLDETRALLLRHMRDASVSSTPSRNNSLESIASRKRPTLESDSNLLTHMAIFDNAYRYTKDQGISRPSRIALSSHWGSAPEAIVTLAGLSPTSSDSTMLTVSRKDLVSALQCDQTTSSTSENVHIVRKYLREHRDIQPLAHVHFARNRYLGLTNTTEMGIWATLDSNVTVTSVDMDHIGEPLPQTQTGDVFPYSILHIRWEAARIPPAARAFDESHLVERVEGFTLEDLAIHAVQKDLAEPSWHPLLQKDIRKVPTSPRMSRLGSASRSRLNVADMAGTSSGPSSTDGPQGSIFSAGTVEAVSVTSESAEQGNTGPSRVSAVANKPRRKKIARIKVPERAPSPVRYWNEFDDGDSDVNQGGGYVIYVDPDEPAFPGAEKMAQAFGALYDSLSRGTTKLVSWLPLHSEKGQDGFAGERSPLLSGENDDFDTSGSDTEGSIVQRSPRQANRRRQSHRPRSGTSTSYRPGQVLTPRQKALEQMLFMFYSGLIAISYVLLIMSSILLGTGRRKAYVEVDAGVVAGVVSAETCAIAATILIMMRRQQLSVLHWGLVAVLVSSVVVVGVALLSFMFAGVAPGSDKKGSGGKSARITGNQ